MVNNVLEDFVSVKGQHIEILDLEEYGKSLFIDNEIQVSESDEHLYSNTMVDSSARLNSVNGDVAVIGGGDGGVGVLFSNYTAYGGAGGGGTANGYFSGGGGGGGTSSAGDGGNGGGGNGGSGSLGIAATVGTGGGGGGSNANGTAGAGGSGFIGLSYLPFTIAAAGTLISSAMTVEDAKTEISGVMVYRDFAGTATLGTDLKIEGTCDGGSNYTEFGYDAITPLFDTNLKMVRLDKGTFTSGTDIRYRLTFANQSAGSKETHVYGVGLAY